LKYQQDALEIHKEIGYTQGIALTLGNIGNIYQLKGELDKALKYEKEALEMKEAIG
jgi:tetratricopeptide (TPR) repeat protein